MLKQDEHVANDRIERHGMARGWLLPGQRQEALHHALAAFHRLPKHLQVLVPRARAPFFLQVVELHGSHGQGIVEFMGYIGQQRP